MTIGIISNTELSIPLLHHLKSSGVDIKFYIGSGIPDQKNNASLISFCASSSIDTCKGDDEEQLYQWFEKHQPDFTFIYGYRSIIDIHRLAALQKKIFNIHPGKLPEFRGPQPVFWQLKNGVENVGLSIHLLSEKLDSGAIVWSRQIPNEPHLTHGLVDFLFSNLLIEGANNIIGSDSARNLVDAAVRQDESKAVFYKRPVLKDVLINWNKMTAAEIINLVKACNPWNIGAISIFENMEVKIVDAEPGASCKDGVLAGSIIHTDNGIRVKTSDDMSIVINHLQINGIFVPSRFASKFGFSPGQKFISPDLNSSDIM